MLLTRLLQAICFSFLALSVLSCSLSRADSSEIFGRTTVRLNLRNVPGLHGDVLRVFEKNESVLILGQADPGWLEYVEGNLDRIQSSKISGMHDDGEGVRRKPKKPDAVRKGKIPMLRNTQE